MIPYIFLGFGVLAVIGMLYCIIMLFILRRRLIYLYEFKKDNQWMKWPSEQIKRFKTKHPFDEGYITPWYGLQFNKILKNALKEK